MLARFLIVTGSCGGSDAGLDAARRLVDAAGAELSASERGMLEGRTQQHREAAAALRTTGDGYERARYVLRGARGAPSDP
jgi:hypothetical protein